MKKFDIYLTAEAYIRVMLEYRNGLFKGFVSGKKVSLYNLGSGARAWGFESLHPQ